MLACPSEEARTLAAAPRISAATRSLSPRRRSGEGSSRLMGAGSGMARRVGDVYRLSDETCVYRKRTALAEGRSDVWVSEDPELCSSLLVSTSTGASDVLLGHHRHRPRRLHTLACRNGVPYQVERVVCSKCAEVFVERRLRRAEA